MHPSLPLLAAYAVNSALNTLTSQIVVPPVIIQGNVEALEASQDAYDHAVTRANRNAYDVLSAMSQEERAECFIAAFRGDALLAAGVNVFDTALGVHEAGLKAALETVWKMEKVRLV